ncbi:hypothetical protein BDF20DRAFT_831310 [Mycotypha africana]|uniref:uncharacterized protein n=1 Tax=Mycotypha africana TaxID=64632 RepID=UPI002301BFE9|nr:uncharacterized protein BDF20DRAFT_831310 [Mycotypha africana]KAI8991254.1 hypothetical protein BDF20DRAFT_831310 [Mycotypha africana]
MYLSEGYMHTNKEVEFEQSVNTCVEELISTSVVKMSFDIPTNLFNSITDKRGNIRKRSEDILTALRSQRVYTKLAIKKYSQRFLDSSISEFYIDLTDADTIKLLKIAQGRKPILVAVLCKPTMKELPISPTGNLLHTIYINPGIRNPIRHQSIHCILRKPLKARCKYLLSMFELPFTLNLSVLILQFSAPENSKTIALSLLRYDKVVCIHVK